MAVTKYKLQGIQYDSTDHRTALVSASIYDPADEEGTRRRVTVRVSFVGVADEAAFLTAVEAALKSVRDNLDGIYYCKTQGNVERSIPA